MEVYILDSLFRRTQVYDVFESLIWTERFADIGDFELHIKSTNETRSAFATGTKLAINNSYRVMTVETVEDATDDSGKSVLHVKGRSLESLLEDRVARDTGTDLITEPVWIVSGTPSGVAQAMFYNVCMAGTLDLHDIIPLIQPGSIFPYGSLPAPADEITWRQEPDSLFNAIKKICDLYDLGFRLVRNFDLSQLYFDIYTGNDLTTRQTDFTPVIFAVNLENLQNTTEYSSIEKTKNVAYVFSDVGFAVVYGDNVDPDTAGFDRHVLMVNAGGDVTVDTVDIPGALQEAGRQALAEYRSQSYFDGELNQDSEYKYGVDYQLGDLVELRNVDGITSYKRVTEQIFVDDEQGERSYPTLSLDLFVNINSWLAYGKKTTTWFDFDYFGYIYCGWAPPADLASLPSGVTVNLINGTRFDGGASTQERGLLDPAGLTRKVTVWFDGTYVEGQLAFTNAWDGYLRIYIIASNTVEREDVVVTDSTGPQTQSMTVDYLNGAWLTFPVHVNAGGTIDIRATKTAGSYAIISGIFLDNDNENSAWADM